MTNFIEKLKKYVKRIEKEKTSLKKVKKSVKKKGKPTYKIPAQSPAEYKRIFFKREFAEGLRS